MRMLHIACKELKAFRDPAMLVFMLATPLAIMLILGTALSRGFDGEIEIGEIRVLYRLEQPDRTLGQVWSEFVRDAESSGVRFEVSDNGAGIPAERLERLRQLLRDNPLSVEARTEQKEFYGLRNVHHRLLLHYGQDAGLTVESAEGKGTTVSFRIPAARNEGEKDA